MKHYLYLLLLAAICGSTVSCQQMEEDLTPTLAKDIISYATTDDNLYYVTVDTDKKTANIYSFVNETDTNLVVPNAITYNNVVYTVTELGGVYSKVTNITCPNTLKIISTNCFYNSPMKIISIPETVDSIGIRAFMSCKNLEQVNIPSGVKTIPTQAFEGCHSLQSIDLPKGLKKIGSYAFMYTGLKEVTFPSTLEEIKYSAFYGCNNLKSIILPESLTELGGIDAEDVNHDEGYVFARCTSLTSVVIPSKISAIKRGLFTGCTQLQNVTLGKGVKNIEEKAFKDCTNLKNLCVYATTPPTLDDENIFSETNYKNCTLYVPESALAAYKEATGWKNFQNISTQFPDESTTGEELKFSLTDDNHTLTEGTYKPGNLTYSRTNSNIEAGKYVTLCLPFPINLAETDCFSEVQMPKDIALYNTNSKMLTILMTKVSNTAIIPAGKPFLAKLNGNKLELKNSNNTYIRSTYAEDLAANMETTIEVYNYDGTSGILESNEDLDVKFCGTFEKKTGLDKENYRTFTTTGSFARDSQVNPFRAYIYKASKTSQANVQSLSISTNGVGDAILKGNYTIKENKLIINK